MLNGWGQLTLAGQASRGARLALIAAVTLTALVAWPRAAAHAQDGERVEALTWSDAPLAPRAAGPAGALADITGVDEAAIVATREYRVGDLEAFIPLGSRDRAPRAFVLAYRSQHAYFWFERGLTPAEAELERAAQLFDERIWPLNARMVGDASLEGDAPLHVISQRSIGPGILGAFNPNDLCPRASCPTSNERAIIYLSQDAAPLGSTEFLTTLAHEHQHLLQFYTDGNERRWLNEGLSQLAEHLNGFDPQAIGISNVSRFLAAPDHYLSGWLFNDRDVARNYGAAYLFLVYLYEQFGLDFINTVATSEHDGLASIQAALAGLDGASNVDEVFADWILANLLDDPFVGDGRYYYRTLDLPQAIAPQPLAVPQDGVLYRDQINQYGADYLLLEGPATYQISFDGADETTVLGVQPPSGEWMWWSNDLNSSAVNLTAAFDLSHLSTATLVFSAWWDIETKGDWFQVLVSGDGGSTWRAMRGPSAGGHSQVAGPAYSGPSGAWVEERVDLSDFAGRQVLVRFEYVTDGGRALRGVALDDLGIVELGELDDVENPSSAWTADGFLRIRDRVAQGWALAVVVRAPGQPATVERVPLDALNTGRVSVTVPDGATATLAVGAMAPFTATPAPYKISIARAP
ncbi:MAG: immune inhibitor A [Anaerolineae bacterium]|nr:immune inhibitor A [Anaerolineae bacterium]